MLRQIKTYKCICDNCGYEAVHEIDGANKFPLYWGSAKLTEHKETRLQAFTHDLCPECVLQIAAKNEKFLQKYYDLKQF